MDGRLQFVKYLCSEKLSTQMNNYSKILPLLIKVAQQRSGTGISLFNEASSRQIKVFNYMKEDNTTMTPESLSL